MKAKPTLRLSSWFEPDRIVRCPACHEPLPGDWRHEGWVEVPSGSGWISGYRVVMRRGRPVVAEVRVLPEEAGRSSPGDWSHDPDHVPAEGVPAGLLRSLRISDAIGLFGRFVRAWTKELGTGPASAMLARVELSPKRRRVNRRPGRAGRPDAYYATWAQAYVERLRQGSLHPVKDLARRPPVRFEDAGAGKRDVEAGVRTILGEARHRGLLSPAPPGRAGGELTARAIEVLS